jgi:DNA invertase Pin-like site-specific DNA recombinase
MTQDSARKITATHLSRKAFVYVGQSTLKQVADNQESTRRQYALRERARALGWPLEQLVVIDSDLGVSGASADREGFQRLVAEVSMRRVGIVLGLEVSRLARNCTDWHRLLEICGLTETLILDEDGVYDPTNYNYRLLLGLKGTLSEAELHMLRARMRGGLLAKARRGELRIGLPVGLVYDELGRVMLHPDAQVQSTIQLFFRTFFRTGAACATVKYFNEKNIAFPAPAKVGAHSDRVVWGRLNLSRAVNLLHNPRYAGAYAFGRRRSRKQSGGRQHTTRLPREQWEVLLLDAHPGYISWQEHERIEEQLRASARAYKIRERTAPPREGPALLQGMALCGRCGGRMSVRYHRRGDKLVPDYICQVRTKQYQKPACQVIPGRDIDAAVGQLLIDAMSPVAVELTLAVQAELDARSEETDRLRGQQVVRAEHEAEQARRRYMQVDATNRLVASSLEADWNDKLRAVSDLCERIERERSASRAAFDDAAKQRVRALATDLPAVWNDPATPERERKRIVAMLLADVTLLREERHITVGIRFRGGATSSLQLPLPLSAWRRRLTHPDVVARVEQLFEKHDADEVARRLNAEGLCTGAQQPFNAEAVRWVCYTRGLKTPLARLRDTGKLTASEMTALLGMPESTVRKWARDGRLRATLNGRKPQWLFDPIAEQSAMVQQLVARRASAQGLQASPKSPVWLARMRELLLCGHEDAVVAEHLNTEGCSRPSNRPFDA